MNLNFTTQPPRSGQTPNRCLVVLHGWGANLYDLTMLASELNLPNYQFVFVEAPFPHPQVRGGRAWYALESPDRDGLETSRTLLRDFLNHLEAEIQVPLFRTILLGFSQGGAMALDVGNRLPLKGICCLSGYPHSPLKVTVKPPPPVLIIHGQADPIVLVSEAQKARQELEKLGSRVTYQEFAMMGHEIPPDAIALIREFIQDLA